MSRSPVGEAAYRACNFLVLGLGHVECSQLQWQDSLSQRTRSRDNADQAPVPALESYHVNYNSKVNQANNLMEVGRGLECTALGDPKYSMCQLALKGLPEEVYNTEVEDNFSKAFLCNGYMRKQEGRLRHFTIPSHRDDLQRPFLSGVAFFCRSPILSEIDSILPTSRLLVSSLKI